MRRQSASNNHRPIAQTRARFCLLAGALLLFASACSSGNKNDDAPDVINIDATTADAGGSDGGVSDVVDPDTVDPDVGDPDTVDPDVVDPDAVDPDTVDPDVVDPDTVDPDTVDPDVVDPDTVDPDTVDPDTTSATVAPGFLSSPTRGAAGGRASSGRFTAVFAFSSAAPPTSSDEYLLNPSPTRVETP